MEWHRKRTYNKRKKQQEQQRKEEREKGSHTENEPLNYALRSEILIIVLLALMLFLFLCNFGVCGSFGNMMSSIMFGIFGFMAYFTPILIFCGCFIYPIMVR